MKWSSCLIGEPQMSLESLGTRQVQRVASSITNDDSHPLHGEFQLLPSGRRFTVPRGKTKQYRNSSVAAANVHLNGL